MRHKTKNDHPHYNEFVNEPVDGNIPEAAPWSSYHKKTCIHHHVHPGNLVGGCQARLSRLLWKDQDTTGNGRWHPLETWHILTSAFANSMMAAFWLHVPWQRKSELPGKIFSMRMTRLLFKKTEKGENSFETKTWQGNRFLVVLFCTNTAIVHFSFVDHITSFLGFSLFPWLCTFSSPFTLRIRGGSKPKWVQDHRKWSEQHDVPASWFLFRLPNHNTFCQVHIKENYWPYILVHWDEIGLGNLAREIASSCWSGGYKTRGAGGSLRFQ